ncbi:MAG: adenylate/guanylate cyclase domain-containing protein [candidate division KSB1 bacterium]
MEAHKSTPVYHQATMSRKNICKLSAIMFTDIKGFSRRMGESEQLTLKLLRDHNRIIRFLVRKHRGRIVKSTGDGFLIDFDSAVVALQCAVEAQQRFLRYNEKKAELDRILVRISVSLGEVMIVDGDLFGDEVNISARIQQLADPGGICITREVYERVKSKLSLLAVNMGPQNLKNIRQPVEVYKVLIKDPSQGTVAAPENEAEENVVTEVSSVAQAEEQSAAPATPETIATLAPPPALPAARRWTARQYTSAFSLAAVLLLALLALSGAGGKIFAWKKEPPRQAGLVEVPTRLLALANKTMLVSYFENRTRDERDDWMCIGLADMLITDLQRHTSLRVFGRPQINDALSLLGVKSEQAMSLTLARKVAQNIEADFMLCGAVAHEGKRLRFDVQLFDARSGELLLADTEQGESVFQMIDQLAERLRKKLN